MTTSSSTSFINFVLAGLAVAAAKARLAAVEVDTIGAALRGGFIGGDDAIRWLRETGFDLTALSTNVT